MKRCLSHSEAEYRAYVTIPYIYVLLRLTCLGNLPSGLGLHLVPNITEKIAEGFIRRIAPEDLKSEGGGAWKSQHAGSSAYCFR
jgi:hypothetical protein